MDPELQWRSLSWPDGSLYEGLTKDGKLESHGVLVHPNKDRYEGQFEAGRMDGYGVFVWRNGTMYRGEWVHGMMHGCGVKLWKDADGGFKAAEGKFFADEYVGPIMPCSTEDTLDAAVEADVAASQARSFQTAEGRRRLMGGTAADRGAPAKEAQWRQSTAAESTPSSTSSGPSSQHPAGNWWERLLGRGGTSSSRTNGPSSSQGTDRAMGAQNAVLSHSEKEKEEKLGPFLHRLMSAEASKLATSVHRSSRQ